MPDPEMEGVERRLQESHDRIEVRDSEQQRRETSVANIDGIEANVIPPRDLIRKLEGSMPGALCDQKMQVVWPSGPNKGMPLTAYCAEPLCITEGVCTGTRFVPHTIQWTSTDVNIRRSRVPDRTETIQGVRLFAKRAAMQTGRDEDRTDNEIIEFVKLVWRKTAEQVRSKGQWRRM